MKEEEKYTFEKVWQALMETRDCQKESAADFDRRMKESAAEADKRSAKSDKSMDDLKNHLKEIQKELGGVGKSNGQVAEETIYNALEKDMTFAGIKFHSIDKNWNRKETALKLHAEFDIVLINDDTLALIETKYKVKDTNVIKLVDTTSNNFRVLYPQYNNYKIVLGVGGMAFEQKAIKEANTNGVGLIKIVGDKVEFQTENIKQY